MNERDVIDAQTRAHKAKQILDDPLFTAAVDEVGATIRAAWSRTPTTATAEREQLWLMDRCLERVVRALKVHIETGKVVEADVLGQKSLLRRVIG